MKKYINLILLILWMVLIFAMSSFDASESGNQSGFIVNLIGDIFNIRDLELLSFIIRKLAHITEFMILGILTINCFKDYKFNNLLLLSVIFGIFYACTDEFHQIFVSGRSGSIKDVCIDSFGVLMGTYGYYLAIIRNKIKQ